MGSHPQGTNLRSSERQQKREQRNGTAVAYHAMSYRTLHAGTNSPRWPRNDDEVQNCCCTRQFLAWSIARKNIGSRKCDTADQRACLIACASTKLPYVDQIRLLRLETYYGICQCSSKGLIRDRGGRYEQRRNRHKKNQTRTDVDAIRELLKPLL